MCQHGNTKVLIINRKPRDIDSCIYHIVKALNECDVETIASCCGHGYRPGNIALRDGREIIIARNFKEARKIDAVFPLDINGNIVGNNKRGI